MRKNIIKLGLIGGVSVLALSVSSIVYAQNAPNITNFDVDAGSLSVALADYMKQSGQQVIYRDDHINDLSTSGVSGSQTNENALEKILENTGLVVRTDKNSGAQLITSLNSSNESGGSGKSARVNQVPEKIKSIAPENTQDDAEKNGIETIIVTASRRSVKMRDEPSSVTAIGSTHLAMLNASRLDDFIGQIPNINFTGSGSSNRQIILRGISTSTNSQSATVATYIDDVPVGSSTALAIGSKYKPDVNVFDLKRVEVLRGPQGTRYGANALGGLIKYVTKEPTLDATTIEARLDSHSVKDGDVGYGIDAAMNLPINDNTAIRVSAFKREEAGYIDNIALGQEDVNDIDMIGGRISILSMPTENFSLKATAMIQNTDIGGASSVEFDGLPGTPRFDEYEQERFAPEPLSSDIQLYSLTLDYDFGFANLISTTSYNSIDVSDVLDWTVAEGGVNSGFLDVVSFPETSNSSTDKLSQELKLTSEQSDKLEWAIGVFMTWEDSFYFAREQGLLADGTPGMEVPSWAAGQGTPANMYTTDWQSEYQQMAVYGEFKTSLTDDFDITGGVRYSNNKTDFDQLLSGVWLFNGGVDSVFPQVSSEDNATTFLITPRWRISDNTMLYARAAQGFRPGGPNALSPVAIAAGADTVYDSESLTNYEVGVKTSFFDNNLYAELTGFYIDWDDIQIRQVTGGFAFTANGSKARSKGVELTLTAKPTDGLDLNFNLGYTNAELVDDAPSVGGVKGDELPNAPKLTLGAMGNYAFSINSDYTANVGLSWRHVDDRLSDFSAERLVLEAYDTVGLHAGLSFNNLQFQLYVKNLTNERGVDSVSTYFGRASVSRPRMIGASVTVRY